MPISAQFLQYILEQLQGLGQLTSRRMFSGVGLYSGDIFFGLLYGDRLYFKTDDSTRPDYEARGSEGFRPRANIQRMKVNYYTVPADILEDGDELVRWARKAVQAALTSRVEKAPRPGRRARTAGSARPTSTVKRRARQPR